MRFKRPFAFAMLLGLVAQAASANIGPPRPRPAPEKAPAQVRVSVGGSDQPVRLLVPRSMVGAAKADAGDGGGGANDAFAGRLPTVMIGTALAAALTLGGLRLASRKRPAAHTLAIVLGVSALVAGSGVALANRAPTFDKKPVPAPPIATFPVVIELTDGDAVELRMTADQAAKLQPAPPAAK